MTTNDDFNPGTRVHRATARVASTAKDGIDAASAGADRAMDAAFGMLDHARNTTAPALRQGIDQARGWVDGKAGRVQDGARAARDQANDVADRVTDYARDEPVKALLIAAAAGVALTALLGVIARSGD